MSTVKRNRAVLRIRIVSYVHGSVGGADIADILAEEVDWHRCLLPLSSYPKRLSEWSRLDYETHDKS